MALTSPRLTSFSIAAQVSSRLTPLNNIWDGHGHHQGHHHGHRHFHHHRHSQTSPFPNNHNHRNLAVLVPRNIALAVNESRRPVDDVEVEIVLMMMMWMVMMVMINDDEDVDDY